tara:strand:- start:51 stop:260 length:210 start_codon:yes stop_codon:yes gene_type:complete
MFGKIIAYFDDLIILGFTKIGLIIDDIMRFIELIVDEFVILIEGIVNIIYKIFEFFVDVPNLITNVLFN